MRRAIVLSGVSSIALTVGLCFSTLASAQAAAPGVLGSAISTGASSAGGDSGVGLEEVVVTAQKREQNLQNVGISVTAISGAEILERGVSNSVDLITRTPSVDSYSPYGPGSNANIVVRGVGLNDAGEGHEAPVTVYVDEFYLVSVPAVDFALFDLSRAEVLRGPQGTLFGRNSTGGLVHYVTQRPTDDVTGYVKASYARFNEVKVEGAANAALTDNLSARLSFLSHHSDGYIRNLNPALAGDKGGAAGVDAVRGQLRYLGGDWDVLLKAEYGRQDRVHTYYEQIPTLRDPVTGLASLNPAGTDAAGYNETRAGAGARNVAYTSDPQRLKSDAGTVLLRAERTAGATTFTSITGFMHLKRHITEDCDASPNRTCFADFPYETDTATQEFRLYHDGERVRWTAGVYGLYAKSKNRPSAVFNVPLSGPTAVDPATGLYNGAFFPLALSADWRQRTTSISGFGQGELAVTPELTLIAGARVTRDIKRFADRDNASLRACPGFPIPTNCFLPPAGPGVPTPFSDRYEKTLISGKIEADYKPTENALIFASISRGTKAGGFNNGFYPAAVPRNLLVYGDETMIAYEVGAKTTLFDRRLRFNTSAFYYDYNDFQTFNFEGVGGLLTNHDSRSYGSEFELEAAPTDNLRLRLAGSWLKTRIEDVTNGVPGRAPYTADRPMANAPRWTANGGVSYTLPLADERSLAFNWEFNYRSSRYANNFGEPSVRLAGYVEHNADVTYTLNDHVQVQMFARNIGNELPMTKAFQFNDLGYLQHIRAEPRVLGGSVLVRW